MRNPDIALPQYIVDSCYAAITQVYIDMFKVSTKSSLWHYNIELKTSSVPNPEGRKLKKHSSFNMASKRLIRHNLIRNSGNKIKFKKSKYEDTQMFQKNTTLRSSLPSTVLASKNACSLVHNDANPNAKANQSSSKDKKTKSSNLKSMKKISKSTPNFLSMYGDVSLVKFETPFWYVSYLILCLDDFKNYFDFNSGRSNTLFLGFINKAYYYWANWGNTIRSFTWTTKFLPWQIWIVQKVISQ